MKSAARIAVIAWFWVAASASAHPLAPVLLAFEENAEGVWEVSWKTSRFGVPGKALAPLWPEQCAPPGPPEVVESEDAVTARWRLECRAPLEGQRLGVAGLEEANAAALVRVAFADGQHVARLLTAADPVMVVPVRTQRRDPVLAYVRLGVEHILGGTDHLLFLFGLLLLVGYGKTLLKTVTAFTAGHSVTLSLAALGLAVVPSAPAEAAIAMTVFVLATELARGAESRSLLRRFPWAMAFAFGLLHGLGFAGALREVGLPRGEIPLALLSFNAGVEVGQLAFLGSLIAAQRPLAALAARWLPRLRLAAVYAMGSVAACWCLQRLAASM